MFIRNGFVFIVISIVACANQDKEKKSLTKTTADYIRKIPGKDSLVSPDTVAKGKVLISYSDCYMCHKVNIRARGPAFVDIAARYPLDPVYIEVLANRVIYGGSGAWGYAVMTPHKSVSISDAKAMVTYILSLKEK